MVTSSGTSTLAISYISITQALCKSVPHMYIIMVVLVACRLDLVTGSTFIRDTAIIAFIANETISIIENAGLMGVPIPAVVAKAIDILKQKAEGDANTSPGKE